MAQNQEQDRDKLSHINMERMMEFLQSKNVYRCTYENCSAYFDRPYRLAQHLLAHNNIRPYVCKEPNCGKAYTSKSHLDRHLRTVHMPQEKDVVYSCPRCMKGFANRQNLKRHLNTVHKIEFSCEVCQKMFKKKNQLSTHMYQHTGIKAFSCDKCPETFVSLYLKKRHMRYHKMYTCHECGIEFNHWSKYQKHLKVDHRKSDEYICNECGRSFKQRSHIVRHIKIHTGTMPIRTFLCPYENCGRTYSRNSNLKQHILVKHMDILHECMICHARLSTKAKLNYHVQLHYNTGIEPPTPKLVKADRKERKDEGSFKTSTALKLAGLARVPEDLQPSLSGLNEIHEELHTTLVTINEVPKELQSTLSGLSKVNENLHSVASDSYKVPDVTDLETDSKYTIKTEFIEVEVDIPYDI